MSEVETSERPDNSDSACLMNQPHRGFPRLGLVVQTVNDEVRFKALTRARLLARPEGDRVAAIRDLYSENTRRLEAALQFCLKNRISLYRVSSSLYPFLDTDDGVEALEPLLPEINRIGYGFQSAGIRVVIHPDQFVVLNSDSDRVIQNSITILTGQARIFEALVLPRSPWALIEIHGGKRGNIEKLVREIKRLPIEIRSRLGLENDEYAFSAAEILDVCRAAGVPMIFDAHHHLVHEKLESYEDPSVEFFTREARTTWENPDWQLAHISNGRTKQQDRAHSDFIHVMPSSYSNVPWIEIEAKMKEQAIAHLRGHWAPASHELYDELIAQ